MVSIGKEPSAVPPTLDLELVPGIANTWIGAETPKAGDARFILSNAEVMEALKEMDRLGEIRVEGSKIRFIR